MTYEELIAELLSLRKQLPALFIAVDGANIEAQEHAAKYPNFFVTLSEYRNFRQVQDTLDKAIEIARDNVKACQEAMGKIAKDLVYNDKFPLQTWIGIGDGLYLFVSSRSHAPWICQFATQDTLLKMSIASLDE